MVIPPELPRFVAATRPSAVQTLALQAGQTVEARVIGAAPNGGTQVEIRGQVFNLALPTMVRAGDVIRLEVQGTGQQMQLALQPVTPPLTPASPAPAAPGPEVNIPLQTIVEQTPPANTAPPLPARASAAEAAAPQVQPGNVAANASPSTAQATPLTTAPQATVTPSTAPPTSQIAAQASVSPAAPLATQAATISATLAAPAAATIYPQAGNPGLPNPQAVAAAATAFAPPAPPAPAPVPGAVRAIVPAVAVGSATTHASSGNPLPQPPPQPVTPQAALAQMVHDSIPQQGSVTALTTALVSIAGKVVLPEPVVRAAQQVLAGRVAIDAPRFDGAALQAAVRGSGVFQEATLAQGQPLPLTDMKTALLTLRQTLTTWLGQQAPVHAITQVPPPLRGVTPRARAGEAAPAIDPNAAPEEVGRQLLERTESALARVRLHQHASLPDPTGRTADWSMDLPVTVGTQQTLMQIQIHRDQQNETESAAERGWQMRFALSLAGLGEVGAQVSLRAGATGVMLWATEPAASAALEAEIASLRDTLEGAGLRPGAVIVRHGEPPMSAAAAPSGHFVDSRS